MMVSLSLPHRELDDGPRIALAAQPATGILAYEALVGARVRIGVDLMAPERWCSVSFGLRDDTAEPLVAALIGERAVRSLRVLAASPAERPPCSVPVDPGAAGPWIRVAMVDALDRWLQLPLDQSLVDAERGIARTAAARTLPAGAPVRGVVVGEALLLARRASGGVVGHLRALAAQQELPVGLLAAMRWLAEGYADLVEEVTGPDHRLAAVPQAWRVIADRPAANDRAEPSQGSPGHRPTRRPRGGRLASMIDPRQVRARIVALSTDPAAGEVTLTETRIADGPGVLVRVPAYRRALDQAVVQRLLVRLVDAQSADPRGQSVLTAAPAVGGRRYFEGVVPVHEAGVERLRADVFDALSDVPPAVVDTDSALQEVRRATVLLGEWRRLVARAQLPTAMPPPAERLRELARRVAAEPADLPLFAGGPSAGDLVALAEEGDREILRRARAEDDAEGLFSTVRGTRRLMAAEIAAADTARGA